MIPVTRDLVKLTLCHERRLGKEVASLLFFVLDPSLEKLDHARTLGKKDRKTLTDGVNGGEVFKLAADLVVVALSCFLDCGEVLFELVLLCKGSTVDTAKHFVLFVTSPISARNGCQLERLDGGGIGEVRTCAEVSEVSLLEEADLCILGEIVDQFNLVRLTLLLHEFDCFLSGESIAL